MANITQRGSSYLIRVHLGTRTDGTQICRSMTWKPDKPMSPRRALKEAQHQAEVFEEQCRNGLVLDGSIKFADYAERWLRDYAERNVRPTTLASYRQAMTRILPAMGHLRLNKIMPLHLLTFYDNLEEAGIRRDTKYTCSGDLSELLRQRSVTRQTLATLAGVSRASINNLCLGRNAEWRTVEAIASALDVRTEELFEPVDPDRRLSGSSILRYHRVLSSMFSTAVKWQMIPSNPAERVEAPRAETAEARYLTSEEAGELLALLEDEPILYRTAVTVLLYTGMRRGELLGLSWDDVDFDTGVARICRTSIYLPEQGVFVDETKNHSSSRYIKMPSTALASLRQWRAAQAENRLKAGDQWQDARRIFTRWNGLPLHPSTITGWFHSFVERSGLPQISIHSLRHTNATLLIAGNVNVRTVSAHLGHAQTSTTMNIYAHAVQEAEAAAADALEITLHRRA